ncbi:MAG TPA: hypothetical protein VE997_03965 [Candidatus Limnocylindria bacterium]|nr:hypothetical protein [Candidatus Limnocylindria bacterium]
MRRAAAVAVGVAAVLAGCGGEAGDILLVQRSGAIPDAGLQLRFTEDGRVSCNHGPLRQLTSAQTLQARAIQRALAGKNDDGPATRHVSLPPGPDPILRYRVRLEAGAVGFSDDSRGQPQTFFQVAALTRSVAQGICKLPR